MDTWRRIPENALVLNGKIIPIGDEVGTAEAARMLNRSQRRIQSMCDEGILVEGKDWRRSPTITGHSHYLIRKSALASLT